MMKQHSTSRTPLVLVAHLHLLDKREPTSYSYRCLTKALSVIGLLGIIVLLAGPVGGQRAEPHLRRARSLFDQRRFAEAASEAQRARELNPDNVEGWKVGGLSLQLAGLYQESEAVFTAAVKTFSEDAELWFYLARVLYLQSKLRNSEDSARKSIQLRPQYADAHTQLGVVLDAKLEFEAALAAYRRAIELNRQQSRQHALPLVYAGNLLAKLGRLEEAVDCFTTAASFSPRSSEIQLQRGRTLEKLRRVAEAEAAYNQAIAIDGNPQARSQIQRLKSGIFVRASGSKSGSNRSDQVNFSNVATQAGINFVLRNSASPHKYQVETMTGGVAVLDYNNDGWLDIYFVNGADLPSLKKTSPQHWNRLFRNNRNGTFTDVTAEAGVAGAGYDMGIAVADYDNDGDQDIFVAGVDRNILFQNQGNGRFRDVTATAGLDGIDPIRGKMWSVSAAWFDYDNDGNLDLFVVNYCKWNPSTEPYCGDSRQGYRTYCMPDRYEGLPNQLFRNNGDGTFTDVSQATRINRHIGKGMGVAIADYNLDGFADVFVANDTVPNFLFLNTGRGFFEEVALEAGVGVNETGRPVSGMGADFRDYDNDGLPDVVLSALEGETYPLFRNLGKGFFSDESYPSGLGLATLKRSGWGLGFFDFNNDGLKDLLTVNSHAVDNIELYNEQTYRQPNSLFMNAGGGRFTDASSSAGADFQTRGAHRGAAFGDLNNDGKIDVITTSLNEPAAVLLNEAETVNHWLVLTLVGTRSNRDGIGTRIKVTLPSGGVMFNHVTTSVGYASSSDRRVHFGLGKEKIVRNVEIQWPGGTIRVLRNVKADQSLTVKEPGR